MKKIITFLILSSALLISNCSPREACMFACDINFNLCKDECHDDFYDDPVEQANCIIYCGVVTEECEAQCPDDYDTW